MTARRGTSNGNETGNSEDRRRRREWLLAEFGDGTTAPCSLALPGICTGPVTAETLTVDRIVPGCRGGRYVRGNIRPACGPCNSAHGGLTRAGGDVPARRACKEAGGDRAHAARPAPHPGPRCATCHRRRRKAVSEAAHGRRLASHFGITSEEYRALYLAQGGRCYVCRRSTGKARRLAVEHDHDLAALHDHPVDQGCPECITGLVCGPDNQHVLGRLGRRPETYERIAEALRNPPARAVLARMRRTA